MRDAVSGRRTAMWMLVLVLIVVVFWQLSSRRFTEAPSGTDVADVGPETLSQMLSLGKAGVLEFYTTSCPYCAKMAPELARLNASYGDKLFVVKMNAEKYVSEAVKYQVEAVPTLVYFDASGKKVNVAVGYKDFNALVQELKRLKLVD